MSGNGVERALGDHTDLRDASNELLAALRPSDIIDDERLAQLGKRRMEIAHHVREILKLVGENPDRDGLKDTPLRVARAYEELLAGYEEDATIHLGRTFEEAPDGIVAMPGIKFVSLCEHHMLPFYGDINIAYLPGEKIVGISKLVRVADVFARRLQVQERLATQIADVIETTLKPKAVGVRISARHMCMMARGVRQHAPEMTFQVLRGAFLANPFARDEVLAIFDKGGSL